MPPHPSATGEAAEPAAVMAAANAAVVVASATVPPTGAHDAPAPAIADTRTTPGPTRAQALR